MLAPTEGLSGCNGKCNGKRRASENLATKKETKEKAASTKCAGVNPPQKNKFDMIRKKKKRASKGIDQIGRRQLPSPPCLIELVSKHGGLGTTTL